VTGQDGAWKEALSPRLVATGCRMVQGIGRHDEATSPRTFSSLIRLSIGNTLEQMRRQWKSLPTSTTRLHQLGASLCDRITSEMRGLSPKIISGDSRRSENAQTHTNKHTISNMKFKLKLLQIKCHVLGFIKDKAPKCASKDNHSFCESVRLSR
jgi:hypothetical protein